MSGKEVWFYYQKESWCRIIYDFSLGFQKSYFKSSLWFGCIKTTQNNSGTFLELEYVSSTSGLRTEENLREELSHREENNFFSWFFCSPSPPIPKHTQSTKESLPHGEWSCQPQLSQSYGQVEESYLGGAEAGRKPLARERERGHLVGICVRSTRKSRRKWCVSRAKSCNIERLTLAA